LVWIIRRVFMVSPTVTEVVGVFVRFSCAASLGLTFTGACHSPVEGILVCTDDSTQKDYRRYF
jgi:hypothetical protein